MGESTMIQWFPGHMAKAKREIEENLKLVDIVYELLDARIPYSSKNPLVDQILKQKPRLILLTKASLADPNYTKKFLKENPNCLEIDSLTNLNFKKIIPTTHQILKEKLEKEKSKGMKPRPIRTMIVGIPNVGKSTLINRLVNKKVTQVGDKPGVTKAKQWIKISEDLELLDTPGILWPKFDDQKVGIHLALTGAIKDEILSIDDLGDYLLTFLKANYPNNLKERYNIDLNLENLEFIEKLAKARGIFGTDALIRAYTVLINDFRSGKLGKITLDR